MSYLSTHSNVNEGEPSWKTEMDAYCSVRKNGWKEWSQEGMEGWGRGNNFIKKFLEPQPVIF